MKRSWMAVLFLVLQFKSHADMPQVDAMEQEKRINSLVTSLLKYTEVKMGTIVMKRMDCETDRAYCDKVAARMRKKIEDSGKWTFTRKATAADGTLQCSIKQVEDRLVLRGQLTTKAGTAAWEDMVILVDSRSAAVKPTETMAAPPIPATPSPEVKRKVAKFFKKKAKQYKAKTRSKNRRKQPVDEPAGEAKAADVLGEAIRTRTVGAAGGAVSARAFHSTLPAMAKLGIAERVSFDSDRVPASRWKTFWAAFTPIHFGPRGRHVSLGLAYRHYIPTNETFYRGAGEANGIAATASWADLLNLELDYWGREGLAVNQVTGLTGIAISPTLTLPIQLGDYLVFYAGGGGRFESIAVAANHVPDGAISYGNHSVLMTVGTKVKLWNLGLDANWAYDLWATHSPSSMLRIGMLYQVK